MCVQQATRVRCMYANHITAHTYRACAYAAPRMPHTCQERAQLQELASALQNAMRELVSANSGDKERLASEAARLSNLQASLEREKAAVATELAAERRKLEDAKEQRQLEEQQELAVVRDPDCNPDRHPRRPSRARSPGSVGPSQAPCCDGPHVRIPS